LTNTGMRTRNYLIAAIVSSVVAVAASIGFLVCFIQYKRQQRRQEAKRQRRMMQNDTFQSSFNVDYNDPNVDISSEIEIGDCIEMSSLGDPSLISGIAFLEVDNMSLDTYFERVIRATGGGKAPLPGAVLICDSHSLPLPSRDDASLSTVADNDVGCDSQSLPLPSKDDATISLVDKVIYTPSSVPLPTSDDTLSSHDDEKIVAIHRIPSLTETGTSSSLESVDADEENEACLQTQGKDDRSSCARVGDKMPLLVVFDSEPQQGKSTDKEPAGEEYEA